MRDKRDSRSLRIRLLVRIWISLLLLATLIGIVQYQTLSSFLLKAQEQSVQSQLASFTAQEPVNWLTGRQSPPKSYSDLSSGVEVFLYTNDGQLKGVFARKEVNNQVIQNRDRIIQNQLAKRPIVPKRYVLRQKNGDRLLLLVKPVFPNVPTIPNTGFNQKSPLGYMVVTSSLSTVDNTLTNQVKTSVIAVLVVLLLGSIASYFVLRRPLQPLRTISLISERIAAGRYDLRIPVDPNSASEIKYLTEALNHMLETLEHALVKEREAKEEMGQFIADASHELRTPLTSIRGFLEILLKGHTSDTEALHSAHATMLTETERLIGLTETLLTLNRFSATLVEANEKIPSLLPADTLNTLTPLLQSLAYPRTLDINCTADELPLSSEELKHIFYNLVQNAVQHTSDVGKIKVTIVREDSICVLSVADDGEGINPEDLPHIFQRFYRGNQARDKRKGQGAGLGLAIVGDIVKLRHGTIHVDSIPGQGTAICIRLPYPEKEK